MLDLVHREMPESGQIGDDPGVEVSAAAAHDQAAGRRQSHARVDTASTDDGCEAGAIPEMCKHHASVGGRAARDPFELTEQVGVGETMKAIAAKARGLGHRQGPADRGKIAMERGIETDHLRHVRPGADAGLDERDLVGQVIRRQRDQRTQAGEGLRRHPLRAIEALPTMHHSVHDAGEHPCDQVGVDLVEDAVNRGCRADAAHRPLAHVLGISVEREQRVFDARRAAVDGEHEWGLAQPCVDSPRTIHDGTARTRDPAALLTSCPSIAGRPCRSRQATAPNWPPSRRSPSRAHQERSSRMPVEETACR